MPRLWLAVYWNTHICGLWNCRHQSYWIKACTDGYHRVCLLADDIGVFSVAFLAAVSALAPWLAPYPYDRQDLPLGAVAPCRAHWLGTDILGRDLLTRLLFGGRISLLVGLCGTAVSLLIGVAYGAVSGYAGGRTDNVMMRVVDTLYALPFTVFVIVLTVVFGRNLLLLFVAIGAVEWLTMARIVRGQVLALKHEMFVEAAVALGRPHRRIIARHIIPNVVGPVVVYATLTIPRVILLEAFLSFLGLGVQPPLSSWGLLIRDGAEVMESYPWLMVFPGAVLSAEPVRAELPRRRPARRPGPALREKVGPRGIKAWPRSKEAEHAAGSRRPPARYMILTWSGRGSISCRPARARPPQAPGPARLERPQAPRRAPSGGPCHIEDRRRFERRGFLRHRLHSLRSAPRQAPRRTTEACQ